jgi:hypothetical protein
MLLSTVVSGLRLLYLFCLVKKGVYIYIYIYIMYIMTYCIKGNRHICRITGSHAGGYEEFYLLGWSSV